MKKLGEIVRETSESIKQKVTTIGEVARETSKRTKIAMAGIALGFTLMTSGVIYNIINNLPNYDFSPEYERYTEIKQILYTPVTYNELNQETINSVAQLQAERDSLYLLDRISEKMSEKFKRSMTIADQTIRGTFYVLGGGTLMILLSSFVGSGLDSAKKRLRRKKDRADFD